MGTVLCLSQYIQDINGVFMDTEQKAPLNDFMEFMNHHGLNKTEQRIKIAQAFFNFPGHHSLEEFYKYIAEQDNSIGQTTVYRTLKLLCDSGLANEIQFGDNITRYEVAHPNTHHDHMVCLDCGQIVEVCDPRIEKIQKDIAREHGFMLMGHVHNLYGRCSECRAKHART